MNILKSKTLWLSVLIAISGVLEQSATLITQIVGQGNIGIVMMVISIAVAVLRVLTTAPLSEK